MFSRMICLSPYWMYICQGTWQTAALQVVPVAKLGSSVRLYVGTVDPMPPGTSRSLPTPWSALRATIHWR